MSGPHPYCTEHDQPLEWCAHHQLQRECRASISGNCLQLTHGLALCREGECDGEVMDQAAAAAAALATAPVRRSRRKPATGHLGTPAGTGETP